MPGPARRAMRLLLAMPVAVALSSLLGLLANPDFAAQVWASSLAADAVFVLGTAATLLLLRRLAGAHPVALGAVAAGFAALTYALAWELAAPGMASSPSRIVMGQHASGVAAVLLAGSPGLLAWALAAAGVARWLAGLPKAAPATPPPAA